MLTDCLKQKYLTTYYQVYNACRNKTFDYNSRKDGEEKQKYKVSSPYVLHKILCYYLKVDCKLKFIL